MNNRVKLKFITFQTQYKRILVPALINLAAKITCSCLKWFEKKNHAFSWKKKEILINK